nr:hypothetical protein [Tanacetum cinerariifolium]
MSTQQDIYAAGSESRPPMLNKENYVPWSSRLLRLSFLVFLKTSMLLQMMKGSDIGIQEKKAKLFNEWERGVGYYARNYTVKPRRRDAAYLQTQLLVAQKEEAGIQLQEEEYDLMAAAADLDEIEENDNDVIFEDISVEQGGETIEQHPANFKETRALYEETVGSTVVQKSRIQCYNCKEFRHVARECQKPKRAKDAAYHREKMLMCKQEEAGIQLNAEQADWRDDTDDDELEDQELEAHYMYMAQLQQVSPDAADSGPIFDDEPVQKVSNDDHYNVFTMESTHPEQSKSVHDTYPIEQDVRNVSIDSLDMSYDREEIDQNDDDNDLAKER